MDEEKSKVNINWPEDRYRELELIWLDVRHVAIYVCKYVQSLAFLVGGPLDKLSKIEFASLITHREGQEGCLE